MALTLRPNDATINLVIKTGDTFRRTLTFTWPGYAPIVPGDWAAVAQIRLNPRSADVLATFDVDLAVTADPEQLAVTLHLDAATTGALRFAAAEWDLEFVTPDGDVRTPLGGTVALDRDVTRV